MTNRLEQTNTNLKEKILSLLPESGQLSTEINGLKLSRFNKISPPESCFYKPMIAIILQGFKRSMIGNDEFAYGKNHYMVVGVDLPGVYHITQASEDEPFISISLELDRYIISQLLTEMPPASHTTKESMSPVMISAVPDKMLNAFLRLVELLDNPSERAILVPMIMREIHFYVLNSPMGDGLRMVNSTGTKANQIALAIQWLRENYAQPLDVDLLAKFVNMSSSTFHRHFRQVTTFSPLQFQKHLRLYEAERLMLLEGKDVKTVAFQVGYESPSQFSREYKRQFGEAPYRDITQKRI